jgi:protein phosphatase 1L
MDSSETSSLGVLDRLVRTSIFGSCFQCCVCVPEKLYFAVVMSTWFGRALSQNTKQRMEDVITVQLLGNGDGLFIVLDGHNGRTAVDFVADRLPKSILESSEYSAGDIQGALRKGFRCTEDELLKRLKGDAVGSPNDAEHGDSDPDFPILTSGVVVCAVLIRNGVMHVANIGDCRAILCRDDQVLQLTVDHTIADPCERGRVEGLVSAEGCVKGLMVTRSMGNVSVSSLEKCEGQIAEPTVTSYPIEERDQFIVISSDGLHEVVSNETARTTVLRALKRPSATPDKIAQELVDRAVARGSCDNICACVVFLQNRF